MELGTIERVDDSAPTMPSPADFMDTWIANNITMESYSGDIDQLARTETDACLVEAADHGITDVAIVEEMGVDAFTLIKDAMINRPG